MAQETVESLIKRCSHAEGIAQDWRNLYQGAYEIALPQRNIYNCRSQGQSNMENVFVSTGMASVNSFVNNMQSSLTPPFKRWVELEAGDAIPENGKNELNKKLEKLTDAFFSVLNASNFNTSVAEMYYDLAVGTAALLILEGGGEQPINFISVPTAQISLEEGKFGTIGAVFRTHEVTARVVKSTWKDAKLSAVLKKVIKDDPSKKLEFKEVTYLDEEDDIWRYEVIYKQGKDEVRIVTREFEGNPWVITRWSKVAGEVFGRGPLLQALPDLKMLNKGKELAIIAAQFNAFGVYTVEDEGILDPDNVEIFPAGFLRVQNNGGGGRSPSVAALPRTGDVNTQALMFEELEASIKKLMLDNKLPLEAGPVRSATEIVQRIAELQVDLGAAFGRLMFEFIQPLVKRVITILDKQRIIEVPTVEIFNTDTGEVKPVKITVDNFFAKIKVLSPIAKAQALEDVQTVTQAFQIVRELDPEGSALAMGYKVEDLPKWLGGKLGVPADLMRSKEEMQELQAQQSVSQGVAAIARLGGH